MKAVFPSARIPLASDLFILTDRLDAHIMTKLLIPIIFAIFASIFGFAFSQMLVIAIVA